MADLTCRPVHWLGKLSDWMKSCAVRLLRDRCTCPIAPKPTNIKALDRPSMPVHWQSCPPDTLSLLPPICISLSQSSSDLSVCLPSSFLHSLSDVQMLHGSAPLFRDWSSCLKLSVTDSLLLDLNSISSRESNPTSRTRYTPGRFNEWTLNDTHTHTHTPKL